MDLSKKEMRLVYDVITAGLESKDYTPEETEKVNQFRDQLMLGFQGDARYGAFWMIY